MYKTQEVVTSVSKMHMLLMKLDHLDHEQHISLGIMYQKNATSKPCLKRFNLTKTKVEGKRCTNTSLASSGFSMIIKRRVCDHSMKASR